MKNNTNCKFNKIMRLQGKGDLSVSDLIELLSKFDSNASVIFGTVDKNGGLDFDQIDDFIFQLSSFTGEDIAEGNYELNILTYTNK